MSFRPTRKATVAAQAIFRAEAGQQAKDDDLLPSDEEDEDFVVPDEESNGRRKGKSKAEANGSDASSDSSDSDDGENAELEAFGAVSGDEVEPDEHLGASGKRSNGDGRSKRRKVKRAKHDHAPAESVDKGLTKEAVDDLWALFNNDTAPPSALQATAPADATKATLHNVPVSTKKMIRITRKYTFAGEQVEQEVEVEEDSAEARAFQGLPANDEQAAGEPQTAADVSRPALTSARPGHRRPRTSLLDMHTKLGLKPPKMTTLEKSKHDWNKFVAKEKISDDLAKARKDGYLEKQDFLQRVQDKKNEQYEELKGAARINPPA
ncbi:uncharacterized protein L969DRAFT_25732 [Mixia osmundae IAM 14324]|uniref:SWR1-complex protein 5 n=1 Tax=Mixia osmundae (strain CBS 9802 / IAM 14324 / JCM 22182 / KY 12970) TaxID=764103 RepID=G7DWD3_MIXOS|nr:uncharacterized protein L969DRAFT_25732 [Mixia osmundae IAM 14324]KEI37295.1 hypothetical protein L969DRAFT_25732 [Mixia osmundae IAM 14324]GAA94893.1 hypothetical protein E5Q_01548 [Mixia osmundae IAM 14324]